MKKNEFYRESTPGSRIKQGIKKIADPLGIYKRLGDPKLQKRIKKELSPRHLANTYKRMAIKSMKAGSTVGKKINKYLGNEGGLINKFKKTHTLQKTSSFKLRSGNKPSVAKLAGISGGLVGGGTGEKFKKGKTYYKSIDGKTVKAVGDYMPAFVSGAGGVASKKYNKDYQKVGEAAQAYATRPHRTPKAKADKLLSNFNTQVKKADKSLKDAQRLNKNFRKGMSIQRKRMAIDKPKAKKSGGKIKQTPKPTRTQKIKNFLGF
jgi:hypothetical protein